MPDARYRNRICCKAANMRRQASGTWNRRAGLELPRSVRLFEISGILAGNHLNELAVLNLADVIGIVVSKEFASSKAAASQKVKSHNR